MISPAKVYSVLGNPKSLVPLAVKDGANCMGLTTASYITGKKEEAQDRFIDEVGTEAIWIGSIPLSKKILDNTLFRIVKLDAKVDIRNLDNPAIFEKTKKYAPTQEIAKNIEKIGQNAKKFKSLNFAKAIAAMGLGFGAYDLLTNAKQKYTDKKVEEKVRAQMKQNIYDKFERNKNFVKSQNDRNYTTFSSLKHKDNKTSFKGGISEFVLDPVKNMYVLDGGITGQRLAKSRDPQEFVGYAIKEGGFLFFMYYLGDKIQNFMHNRADTKFNKSIELDSRVLENDKFKELFKTGEIEKSLNSFPEYAFEQSKPKSFVQKVQEFFNPPKKTTIQLANDAELYEFIHNNPENAIIKAAKESDIIENYKVKQKGFFGLFKKKIDTGKIDTRKYIDMDMMRKTHSNIQRLYNQFKVSGEDVDTFFEGVRKLKRNSIKANMASSMIALGVILPGIMLAKRLLSNDKEFATTKRIREKIEKENQEKLQLENIKKVEK